MVDYIIVGAGSAGCVLASRLSESPGTSVLLLEAGGRDTQRDIHVPAAWPRLLKSDVDWAFVTEEQPHLNRRRLYWPRGKVLGGSSSINALIYTRGNRRDFDSWAEAGNPGWDFASVEPFFAQSRLRCRSARPGHTLSRAFVEACGELGIAPNDGFNGAEQDGAGFFDVTVDEGKRSSAAVAYLKPAMARGNLAVETQRMVSRIVVEGNRATGVEYLENGTRRIVSARREVILCAGAVQSPHLLLLSGIGPAEQLRAFSIPVRVSLPGVGRHMRDHLLGGVVHELTQPISMADAGTLSDVLQFLLRKKGRLTSNLAEAGAFVRSAAAGDRPDLELIFAPVFYMQHGFLNPEGHGFSVGAVLQHPRSEGAITLGSADPRVPPLIQPHYLADPHDVRVLTEGVQLARRVARSRAFDRYRGKEVWPGEEVRSGDEVSAKIRDLAETLYHPMGTCRMGSDAFAVVDGELRVHGVKDLRVVDASVFPGTITGHPNAVVVMCAEKAADLILA